MNLFRPKTALGKSILIMLAAICTLIMVSCDVTSGDYDDYTYNSSSEDNSAEYQMVIYKRSNSLAVYRKDLSGGYTIEKMCFNCIFGKSVFEKISGDLSLDAKYRWSKLQGERYGQYVCNVGDLTFSSMPYNSQNASDLDIYAYDNSKNAANGKELLFSVKDIKWIYDNIPIGTGVIIMNSEGPVGEQLAPRSDQEEFSGWEPTDKWAVGNPYFTVSSETESDE